MLESEREGKGKITEEERGTAKGIVASHRRKLEDRVPRRQPEDQGGPKQGRGKDVPTGTPTLP